MYSPELDLDIGQQQIYLADANQAVYDFQYVSTYAQQAVNDAQTALSQVQSLYSLDF